MIAASDAVAQRVHQFQRQRARLAPESANRSSWGRAWTSGRFQTKAGSIYRTTDLIKGFRLIGNRWRPWAAVAQAKRGMQAEGPPWHTSTRRCCGGTTEPAGARGGLSANGLFRLLVSQSRSQTPVPTASAGAAATRMRGQARSACARRQRSIERAIRSRNAGSIGSSKGKSTTSATPSSAKRARTRAATGFPVRCRRSALRRPASLRQVARRDAAVLHRPHR